MRIEIIAQSLNCRWQFANHINAGGWYMMRNDLLFFIDKIMFENFTEMENDIAKIQNDLRGVFERTLRNIEVNL